MNERARDQVPAATARSRDPGRTVNRSVAESSLPGVLQLQQTAGNQAVLRLVRSAVLEPSTRKQGLPGWCVQAEAMDDACDQAARSSACDLLQRTGEESSSWDERAGQARSQVASGNTAQAVTLYQTLLAEAINGLPRSRYPASLTTPPQGSPAPASVTPAAVHVRLGNEPGAAITYPDEVELSRGNPARLWDWIYFHRESVGVPRDYTDGLVIHELQHAGDMVSAYHAWFQQPQVMRRDWLGYWEDWKRQRPMRHLEIYETQATEANFASWNDDQKLDWIAGVLVNVPGGLPRGASIPGQTTLVDYYTTAAPPDFKVRIVDLFYDWLFGSAHLSTQPAQRVSILRNFRPIIADLMARRGDEVRPQIETLERVLHTRI